MVYFIIYKTTNLLNKKIYIGQHLVKKQSDLDESYIGTGVEFLKDVKKIKDKFPKIWRKFFKREILCKISSFNQSIADKIEEFYIRKFNSIDPKIGYNILSGTAKNFSSGSPMKIPKIAKKVGNIQRGCKRKPHSKETKELMSKIAKEIWKDEERRKNISCKIKMIMTEERRMKLSKLHKGKKVSSETRKLISLNHADFRGSKHPLFGSKFRWITDGERNKRLKIDEPIPNGYRFGKTERRIK